MTHNEPYLRTMAYNEPYLVTMTHNFGHFDDPFIDEFVFMVFIMELMIFIPIGVCWLEPGISNWVFYNRETKGFLLLQLSGPLLKIML